MKRFSMHGLHTGGIELATNPDSRAIVLQMGRVFRWGIEQRQQGKPVHVYSISGEANPDIWNAPQVAGPLLELWRRGVTYDHMFGPSASVNYADHIFMQAYNYPKSRIRFFILPGRYPYHWTMAAVPSDNPKRIRYRAHVEDFHKPLASSRPAAGLVELVRDNDRHRLEKTGLYFCKLDEFHTLEYDTPRVSTAKELLKTLRVNAKRPRGQ